jgi:hypothetical protein
MNKTLSYDVRYPHLTLEGKEELKVYLIWLEQSKLEDTEKSFIEFAIGRGRFTNGRHLFQIWEYIKANEIIGVSNKMQMLRFFTNPSDTPFDLPELSGWFDFLLVAYGLSKTVKPVVYDFPTFLQQGISFSTNS